MGTFDRAIATAKKLIDKNGQSVELVHNLPDEYNQPKPWRDEEFREVVQSIRAVFLGVGAKKNGTTTDNSVQDGTAVRERSVLIAASGLSLPPSLRSEIRVGAERWRVVGVEVLSPSGEDILYRVQVRQ